MDEGSPGKATCVSALALHFSICREKISAVLPVFYTPQEVGKVLKVTRRQVYTWLTTGALKGYRTGADGSWRITEDAVTKFLKMPATDSK